MRQARRIIKVVTTAGAGPIGQYQTIRVSQHPPAKKRAVSSAPFQLSAI
jgi:hypothetical protein